VANLERLAGKNVQEYAGGGIMTQTGYVFSDCATFCASLMQKSMSRNSTSTTSTSGNVVLTNVNSNATAAG